MTPRIVANTTNEMYVLRHFHAVPKKYAQSLLGKSYEYYDTRKKKFMDARVTKRGIEKALATGGKSKFFPNLTELQTPRKVIARVQKEAKRRTLRWADNGAYKTAKFTFLHTELVGDDIPSRSKRKTRRIGVELAWYKGQTFCYMTAYPCFYS